ncbi:MAG: cytochrome b/b6 domain-containing protein [Desulfurococcales archaeon]|nr:cytochrome b/b6 domain-containing protein [Desulfurococcales archaeon]
MSRRIRVMDLAYRAGHLVNLILFISLIVSGLMLFASDATSWIALAIGQPLSTLEGVDADPVVVGIQWARTWHRVVGLAWGAFVVVYLVYYLSFNRKFHILKAIARSLGEQAREAAALVKHYTLGKPIPWEVKARMGRYNVLTGWLFILLLASTILLSISGVALLYKEQLGLSLSTTRLMYALHDIGFALALGFLLLHTYATLHPSNRPLLRAMFTSGEVPEDWAAEHLGVRGGEE